jgi:polyhydroxybutyrate depolymerase
MPCPSGGWSPGDQRITLTHGGIEREYEVHVPPSYTGTTRVPLVMTIHGAHNTIAMVKGWSKMNPVADANGFIVVYPQAVDCWNSGFTIGGCEAAPDDVGFLKAIVAEVESHACIDPKQVYATGISNGSMMSQYLACEASDVFAAVAGVSGGAQCRNTVPRPVPLFYVHGTEDKTIGYSGAQRTADAWVMRDGCSTTPMETYNMGSTKCVTYGACREGAEVVFCTVTGMGHCWPEDSNCGPGGGAAYGVTDFKASPMMWEFFKRHPLP